MAGGGLQLYKSFHETETQPYLRPVSGACQMSISARVVFEWLWWHLKSWIPSGDWIVVLVIDLATFCHQHMHKLLVN